MKSFITAICVWLALTVGAYANHERPCLPEVDMKTNVEATDKRIGQKPYRVFKESGVYITSYYVYTPGIDALWRDGKYWVIRYDFTADRGCLVFTPKGSLYWYAVLSDELKDRMINKMEKFHEFNWTYDEDFPAYGKSAGIEGTAVGFTKESFQKVFHETERGCQTLDIFMGNMIPILKLYYPTTDIKIYHDEKAGKLVVVEKDNPIIVVGDMVDGCIHDSNQVTITEEHMQYMRDETFVYSNLDN